MAHIVAMYHKFISTDHRPDYVLSPSLVRQILDLQNRERLVGVLSTDVTEVAIKTNQDGARVTLHELVVPALTTVHYCILFIKVKSSHNSTQYFNVYYTGLCHGSN